MRDGQRYRCRRGHRRGDMGQLPTPNVIPEPTPNRPWELVFLGVGSVVFAGCSGNQAIFNPQGPAARSIATLGWTLLAICGVVYALVMLALIWALARRRE